MTAPSRQRQLARIQWVKIGSFLFVLLAILIVLLVNREMLFSVVLATVLTYMMGPLVNAFERTGIERAVAVLITFIFFSFVFGLGILALKPFLVAQSLSLSEDFPRYVDGITRLGQDLEGRIRNLGGGLVDIQLSSHVMNLLKSSANELVQDVTSFLSSSLTVLVLAPFFAFFLLKDGQALRKNLLDIVPNSWFELILNLSHQINVQIGNFIRARLLEAAFVGVVVWAGLAFLGFPYAGLLGLFAALTNLIPYIGPVIGFVPALVISFSNHQTGLEAFWLVVVYSAAQLIDTFFIIPLLVAKIVDLHPVTVLIAVILGAQVMGVLGMLISIPLASALKVTVTSVYRALVDFRY